MKTTVEQLNCVKLHEHKLPTGALGIDYASQSGTAVVACMDGVYRLDIANGSYHRLYCHASYASGVVTSPLQNRFVSAGYDGVLTWYDENCEQIIEQVTAHRFWSWDLASSPNGRMVASVTGQYLAGSYEYDPQPASEPCVHVYDVATQKLLLSVDHLPPVQSVAVNNEYLAAGNLMGEVGVWNIATGEQLAHWKSDDFTGFGIIKSHCNVGGIYAMQFCENNRLLVAGMGPMRDPMAGNGRQLWQEYDWQSGPPRKVRETNKDQAGEGLMETLCVHPSGKFFVMAGRLRGGSWNVGFFDATSGNRIQALKTETRVTEARFSADGSQLLLAAAKSQPKDLKKPFGRVHVYEISQEELG